MGGRKRNAIVKVGREVGSEKRVREGERKRKGIGRNEERKITKNENIEKKWDNHKIRADDDNSNNKDNINNDNNIKK